MLHLRHPRDRAGDRRGTCLVGGSEARFVRNRWMLPAELKRASAEGIVDRERLLCSVCGPSARLRGMAAALASLFGGEATSVAGLVEENAFRPLAVLELNALGRMH